MFEFIISPALFCTGLPRFARNDVRDRHCEHVVRGNPVQAFSLVELLVSLIIISVIIAVFTPILTKKLKNSQIALSSSGEITTECQNSPNYGEKCELCTKKYCIKCGLDKCETGKYIDVKKCDCADCKDWDEKCIACNSNGCTRCATSAYYVKDGKCEPYPTGHYCDGVTDYATCPGAGYYCDSLGIHKCTDAYHSACATCNASTCLTCGSSYYVSGKVCAPCEMTGCTQCTSTTYCTACFGNLILNTTTHRCDATCISKMEGCYTCTSATNCTSCYGGYYLNTAHTCTKCTLSNCQKCVNNRASNSQACETCKAGYYLSGGACYSCASKYGTGCVACDATQCTSCIQGYHLNENSKGNPSCTDNDNKFACSDSNFMQIGNLCVTRKNMGDSYALTIPSTVTIAQAPNEYCYATNQKCCWKGTTSNNCNNDNGGYSGCSRTVCNWSAAKEICEKFNYQGKTWRLPTNDEMKMWHTNSIAIGSNGLMLCDASGGYSSARCTDSYSCPGSHDGYCNTRCVWSGQFTSTLVSYYYSLVTGMLYGPGVDYASHAFSVRCVSDM